MRAANMRREECRLTTLETEYKKTLEKEERRMTTKYLC